MGVWGQFKDRVAGKGSGGRIFEAEAKGQEVRVNWAGLKLGPAGFLGGELLIKEGVESPRWN